MMGARFVSSLGKCGKLLTYLYRWGNIRIRFEQGPSVGLESFWSDLKWGWEVPWFVFCIGLSEYET